MKTTKKVLTESPNIVVSDFEVAKVFAASTDVGFSNASINTNLSGLEWDED